MQNQGNFKNIVYFYENAKPKKNSSSHLFYHLVIKKRVMLNTENTKQALRFGTDFRFAEYVAVIFYTRVWHMHGSHLKLTKFCDIYVFPVNRCTIPENDVS